MMRRDDRSARGERPGLKRLILAISPLETGRSPLEMSVDLDQLELGEWVRPLAPLQLVGSVDKFGESVTVRGHGEAPVEETCARCTKPFQRPLQVDILVYCDRRGSDAEADTRQLEQEGEVVYHDGVSVDLTEPVREAVILAQPMNPLCREDCKGLCPQCGIDRNTGTCSCEPPIDPRLAALKGLKLPP